ncbi:formate dehydrogenase accessory sulfurtransferase FdhD [Halobacillus sp. BBL2006]|uniref:formate dehydrogenase accessory sulfurtransferase FdhD n=1 Tax=Halobacillus sp. BBL2006 TaxID=1543706 RepID=UPI00054343FA|nr:formate dehydrogenase accessory sulfurtransferase FdhD [Halobacillus sp. BBL2006]KHE66794.1 formate dehydrogenase [Halobacillus sp. BBL2006]
MEKGTVTWDMIKIHQQTAENITDEVAEEFPLTIMINGEEFATMVCSPIHLEELVIGYLATEGIIRSMKDLHSISIDKDTGFAYVETGKPLPDLAVHQKRWIGSCCGKSRAFYFQNDANTARTVMSHFTIKPEQCSYLMDQFQGAAQMFQRTGGVHQAAIATNDGIEIQFADIGRHNALDKLYGYMIKNRWKVKDKVIIFSGRISSEVLLKVSKMGIGCLLSKSAPTNLALQLAEDLNITAVGFVRGERMNVYTHSERIELDSLKTTE